MRRIRFPGLTWMFLFCFLPGLLSAAQDYRVEGLNEPVPDKTISPALRKQIAATGYRVLRGTKRTVCDLWLCREWPIQAGFQPTDSVLYPFESGELIGVLRFRRRGHDFRDQQIARGVYTLRYARQPVDGNHEGTSPTRDFLLLVRAAADPSPEPLAEETLDTASAEAAESSHPALLCLQAVVGAATARTAEVRTDPQHGWIVIRLVGTALSAGHAKRMPIDLVVVGHADE